MTWKVPATIHISAPDWLVQYLVVYLSTIFMTSF